MAQGPSCRCRLVFFAALFLAYGGFDQPETGDPTDAQRRHSNIYTMQSAEESMAMRHAPSTVSGAGTNVLGPGDDNASIQLLHMSMFWYDHDTSIGDPGDV